MMQRSLVALFAIVVALVTLIAPVPARAEGEPVGSYALGARTVRVRLNAPPVTKIRVSFDHARGGHVEVDFDPARDDGLTRVITLQNDNMAAEWRVSVAADPIVLSAGPNAHYIRAEQADDPKQPERKLPVGTSTTLFNLAMRDALGSTSRPSGDAGPTAPAPFAAYSIWIDVDPTDLSNQLPQISARATLPPAPSNGLRSAEAPAVVEELLRTLAEVAIDRARSRGVAFLSSELRKVLCESLVWSPPLARALQWPADTKGPLLPRTCRAFENIRLEEIGATARTLYPELLADLAEIGLGTLQNAIASSSLRVAAPALVRRVEARERESKTPAFVRRHLEQIHQELLRPDPSFARFDELIRSAILAASDARDIVLVVRDTKPDTDPKVLRARAVQVLGALLRHPSLIGAQDGPTVTALRELRHALSQQRSDGEVWTLAALSFHHYQRELDQYAQRGADERRKIDEVEATIRAGGAGAIKAVLGFAAKRVAPLEGMENWSGWRLLNEIASTPPAERPQVLFQRARALVEVLGEPIAGVGTSSPVEDLAADIAPLRGVLLSFARLLPDLASGRNPSETIAQSMLLELFRWTRLEQYCSQSPKGELNDQAACAWACGIDITKRVIASCQSRSVECTASDVMRLLDNAVPRGTCAEALPNPVGAWPELPAVIAESLEALRPKAETSRIRVAELATKFTFDVLEQRLCHQQASSHCGDLRDIRRMFRAIVDGDTVRVLLASGTLFDHAFTRALADLDAKGWQTTEQRAHLRKFLRIATAMTAYASTYATDDKGDPERAKESHDARKKAVEGLIDAATDRSGRGGQVVLSLGINPGLGLSGYQHLPKRDPEDQYLPPQLSLPMGIALQVLPPNKDGDRVAIGHHAQVSLIDLGQFVATTKDAEVNKPRWDSFLMIGAQYGLIIGTPSHNFMLGADVRWAPTLFAEEGDPANGAGAFRVGGFASYYVPFIDLN